MPLRAIVNGVSLTSVSIPSWKWIRLKLDVRSGKVRIVLPCCQGRGFLRLSTRHLQHFVHAPGTACARRQQDSGVYLEIIDIIQRAARAAHLPFQLEEKVNGIPVPAVLSLPGRQGRLAMLGFEKSYTAREMERIEKNLLRNHVRGCWLSSAPRLADLDPSLPYFHLQHTPLDWVVDQRGGISLVVFLDHLFQGHFRFRPYAVGRRYMEAWLNIFSVRCPTCGEQAATFHLDGDRLTLCSLVASSAEEYRFSVETIAAVREQARNIHAPLGHVRLFRGARPAGDILCPHCRAVLPDTVQPSSRLLEAFPITIRWKKAQRISRPHWCFSLSGRHC